MNNFQIWSDDNPRPEVTTDYLRLDEGSYSIRHTGIDVWCFEDEGEALTVHVAAKRRYGSIDDIADDVPFSITRGILA